MVIPYYYTVEQEMESMVGKITQRRRFSLNRAFLATADYCYTLDVPTMTWTRQSLIAPLGTSSGPRFQHSGTLYTSEIHTPYVTYRHLCSCLGGKCCLYSVWYRQRCQSYV